AARRRSSPPSARPSTDGMRAWRLWRTRMLALPPAAPARVWVEAAELVPAAALLPARALAAGEWQGAGAGVSGESPLRRPGQLLQSLSAGLERSLRRSIRPLRSDSETESSFESQACRSAAPW